jgi:hypothetical protein
MRGTITAENTKAEIDLVMKERSLLSDDDDACFIWALGKSI